MRNCQSIDPLVTPYVDDEIAVDDRAIVEAHLGVCASCHARVAAEQAIRALIHLRQPALRRECASAALRDRCASGARTPPASAAAGMWPRMRAWPSRVAPLALAATLVLIVGGAFLYQLTDRSTRVLAAELTADHMKCFAVNRVLGTHESASVVESSLAAGFGWGVELPQRPDRAGLELVGARPCLYAEGRVAHIMYRYRGRPVSVFMLPGTVRPDAVTRVMGHECAIWSSGDRTFVLIAREPRDEVERMASFVQAALR